MVDVGANDGLFSLNLMHLAERVPPTGVAPLPAHRRATQPADSLARRCGGKGICPLPFALAPKDLRPQRSHSAVTRDSRATRRVDRWRAMLVLLLSPLQSDLPNDYQKTSPMMQTVGGGVLRSLGRDDPSLGRASVLAPANQRIVSCGGCGRHGNCDMRYGNCSCQMGWGGPHCEQELFPSCRFSPAPPDVVQPGNSLTSSDQAALRMKRDSNPSRT